MSKEEQLSTSGDTPKLKPALQEKYQEEKKELKERPKKILEEMDKLPLPVGWRILVLPFEASKKSKGGIIYSDDAVERASIASTCGNVLAVGNQAYEKEKFPEGPWCKKGDWVVFARYAGSRIKIHGGEVRLLNDDEILATIKNPEDILHEI
jgi:chaperonin GroES